MKTHKVPMDDSSLLSDIFNDSTTDQFGDRDDLFAILESLEDFNDFPSITEAVMSPTITSKENEQNSSRVHLSQKSPSTTTCSGAPQDHSETDNEPAETSPKSSKRQKLAHTSVLEELPNNPDNNGQERILSHITVERNRRKQMNEHLSVLRSLMPCFYVKRGDQASIIEGVVDYINELQQLLQCLEAKKHRKVYNEVLSPRLVVSSPRPSPLSPRKPLPPLSPRILNLPISPTTPQPQPGSPYMPRLMLQQQQQQQQSGYLSPTTLSNSVEPSPTTSSASSSINNNDNNMNIINELVANSKSSVADVAVKFSGPHVLLKTVSQRIPGQALRIMSTLEEELALEILHVSISTADETMLNSFTIKIGIECQLSAEELAQQIQQTFC